jgi:uncharacterized protein (TIRG00374 family)
MTTGTSAPVDVPNPPGPEEDDDDAGAPRFDFTPRKIGFFVAFVLAMVVALYFLLPNLAGLEETWHRIEEGSPWWLALALTCTIGMFGGYVALFQGVYGRSTPRRLNWRESYQVTMASLAATRLFSAGGAGGIVLTAWALRKAGMRKQQVADKTISFLVLTYLVYTGALMVFGYGLHFGVLPGPDPFAMTFVPATLALILTAAGLSLAFIPTDLQSRLDGFATRQGRVGRIAQRLATLPATVSAGMRDALAHLRSRDPALLGAVLFWAFQIAVLWASFRAFGEAPHLSVVIVAFFVGMLGNLLPLPGGIGGVDGGMIGAFAAFGVDARLAVVAVLVYRGFTFWLPTVPGVIAYLQLRKTVERWVSVRRQALSYTK